MEPESSAAPALTREAVERALEQAEHLRKRKEYKDAIDLLVDALETGLLKAQIYYRLGNIYYDAGKLELAEYAYQRAIRFEPDHANAYHNLAVLYRRMGKTGASVEMRRQGYRVELKQARMRRELTPDQRHWMRGIALRMLLLTILAISVICLMIYLVSS